MRVYDVMMAIGGVASTNEKKMILKENMDDTIETIFYDTYGSQKYYIKKYEMPKESGVLSLDCNYDVFHLLLQTLVNRDVTGGDAITELENTLKLFDKDSQEILCRIIDRNLKIGVSMDNFLDVIGKKESKFEVALAENLSKVKGVNPIDGTYFISRKLDGVRCICNICKNDESIDISFKSRQGKPFTTLGNLIEPIKSFTQCLQNGNWVLDGEICIIDENGNESFHGLMKEITRKNHTISTPKYNVFDCMSKEVFDGECVGETFGCRLEMMNHDLVSNLLVHVIDQERVTTQEILDKWVALAKKNKWEGCMLRKDAPYKRGRSKDLLKIKEMQDAEFKVVGVEFGTAVYNEGGVKEYDIVSSLVIMHKGNEVSVGSGLSKEQRLYWRKNPEEIIGRMVTVQYFEETKDSKTGLLSLRFPVLKHVWDESGRDV